MSRCYLIAFGGVKQKNLYKGSQTLHDVIREWQGSKAVNVKADRKIHFHTKSPSCQLAIKLFKEFLPL